MTLVCMYCIPKSMYVNDLAYGPFLFWGTFINDVPRFLAIFDLPTYLVLLCNVPFLGYLGPRGKYFSFCTLKPGGTSLRNWQFGEPFLLAQKANKFLKQARDCRKKYSLIKGRNYLINF